MGGILGTLLSCGIAYACNHFGFSISLGMSGWLDDGGSAQMFLITPWLIALALVFSTLIGIVAGFAPANRAVKIPALTAIRQE
jgi:ABC-type lipoprotein release transport system permease subunit